MFDPRQTLMCRIPLSAIGADCAWSSLQTKHSDILYELKESFPAFKHARSSEIVLRLHSQQNQLMVGVYLRECRQMDLLSPISNGRQCEDMYSAEVVAVAQQLDLSEIMFHRALTIQEPSVVVGDAGQTARVQRRLMLKRNQRVGAQLLAGLPMPKEVKLGSLPKFHPLGTPVTLRARVLSLSRSQVQLKPIELIEAASGPTEAVQEMMPKKLLTYRFGKFASVEFGTYLQSAMDDGLELKLNVQLIHDWVDARVAGAEFR